MKNIITILKNPYMATYLAVGLIFSVALIPHPVLATCGGPSFFFINHWSTALPCVNNDPAITKLSDIAGLGLWAVDSLLKLSAYVAVGFVIWGSIKYIKSQGDPGEIGAAKNTIIQALIGMVICIASVAIIEFVQGAF